MARSREVRCGYAGTQATATPDVLHLTAHGDDANVRVKFEDVARTFGRPLTPRLLDFLEIAAYIYTADCATGRGTGWNRDGSTEAWDRQFTFDVPVADVDFWSSQEVQTRLRHVLRFLTDDQYEFDFRPLASPRNEQGYFDFTEDERWPFSEPDRVLMFSGGLDSLAGAVETAAQGKPLVLVSHRSFPVISRRQSDLFQQLRNTFAVQMLHVPVWLNKTKGLDREPTQRSRSFLFCALGTIVAESVRGRGVRFFENGVVSLNLPVAQEAIRARASRTTHPYALRLLSDLAALVVGREFTVDNPFLFKTKTDVIRVLQEHCAEPLIQYSVSCAHQGRASSRSQYHCGTCSQCIDRRVAVLAAGAEAHDPAFDYRSDVFIGERREGYARNMAVDYAAHVVELSLLNEDDMAVRFASELATAVRGCPRSSESARSLVDLHKRHAVSAMAVLNRQVSVHAPELVNGGLPSSSMLQMIVGKVHRRTSWQRLSERITQVLHDGLPRACESEKPKNEPHLQQICDGLLTSVHPQLQREFPFMRWSASGTKPDWSSEAHLLWVELKYVRKKADIVPITDAIAADITKYGDNNRHVLFVIFDPHHLLLDEEALRAPVVQHGHHLSVVR